VQAKLGIIPQQAADTIVQKCEIGLIDWDDLREQTELIGGPVLAVVKQIVKAVNGEWAHWGATTQVCTHPSVARSNFSHLKDIIGRNRYSYDPSASRYSGSYLHVSIRNHIFPSLAL
jgi:hypothetical protein